MQNDVSAAPQKGGGGGHMGYEYSTPLGLYWNFPYRLPYTVHRLP